MVAGTQLASIASEFLGAIKKFDWTDEQRQSSVKRYSHQEGLKDMRFAGFLLLAAGWLIVTTALFLLHSAGSRAAFVAAGITVQIMGLIFAVRTHRVLESERD